MSDIKLRSADNTDEDVQQTSGISPVDMHGGTLGNRPHIWQADLSANLSPCFISSVFVTVFLQMDNCTTAL